MADFSRAFKLLKKGKSEKKETKIQAINRQTKSKMSMEDKAKRERVKKALKGSM